MLRRSFVRPGHYPPAVALSLSPCSRDEAERLSDSLGVQRVTAEVLVRRGLGDPAAARAFLDREGPLHDPFALGDMADACAPIEGAIANRRRIVVHGDYDVDGVCATALAVETLRELGAEVGWHLPSRFIEGYGVAVETVDVLADEGAALILSVDCGITAVEAVARARERGLAVVVSDHHRPGAELPDAPIVCSRGPYEALYPFAELCGTGVVLQARAGALVAPARHDRALPAELAPQARPRRARDGRRRRRAARTRTARSCAPACAGSPAASARAWRALMEVAGVDRARLRSSDLGFRLGAAHQRRGPARPPARGARPAARARSRRGRCRSRRQLEERNRERQASRTTILRAAVAVDRVRGRPSARRARLRRGRARAGTRA